MPARNGMLDLIERVRLLTDAGTAEHTVQGVDYYSDEHIQERLDRSRMDVYRERLTLQTEYSGGTAIYKKYYFPTADVERADSGSAAWLVEDYQGSAIGTASYTPYYDAQYIEFASNTLGSAYYLTYRQYDVERTAAQVWREKAAFVASRFDVKTDNHEIKRSQLRQAYLENAKLFEAQAKPKVVHMVRTDAY